MPPRVPGLPSLGTLNLCRRPAIKPSVTPFLPLVQIAGLRMNKWEKKRFAKREPYRWAQMQQRKNANLKRREELQKERGKEWGSPVHGIPTPFVESFDSAGQVAQKTEVVKDDEGQPIEKEVELPTSEHILNHFLTKEELDAALQHAFDMTRPIDKSNNPNSSDLQEAIQIHNEKHWHRSEAIRRIVAMDKACGKAKRHANIRRCIEEFGRHNTDLTLRPKPLSITPNPVPMPQRRGPDTGSSEVQISILTAKIRKIAQGLEGPKGYKDKHGKRHLRELCHKRQKLLKYMERQERGSERWTHMLEKLGLSPATWKEQISI